MVSQFLLSFFCLYRETIKYLNCFQLKNLFCWTKFQNFRYRSRKLSQYRDEVNYMNLSFSNCDCSNYYFYNDIVFEQSRKKSEVIMFVTKLYLSSRDFNSTNSETVRNLLYCLGNCKSRSWNLNRCNSNNCNSCRCDLSHCNFNMCNSESCNSKSWLYCVAVSFN